MQPGRESEGSQARPRKPQGQGRRHAYNKAMKSRTAAMLGIPSTIPASSQPAVPNLSQPAAANSPPQMVILFHLFVIVSAAVVHVMSLIESL
jgi:hypothetical protein